MPISNLISISDIINGALSSAASVKSMEKVASEKKIEPAVKIPESDILKLAEELDKAAEEMGVVAKEGGDHPAVSTGDQKAGETASITGAVESKPAGDKPESTTGDNKAVDVIDVNTGDGQKKPDDPAVTTGDNKAVEVLGGEKTAAEDAEDKKSEETKKEEGKDEKGGMPFEKKDGKCEKCGKDPCECPKDDMKKAAEAIGIYLAVNDSILKSIEAGLGKQASLARDAAIAGVSILTGGLLGQTAVKQTEVEKVAEDNADSGQELLANMIYRRLQGGVK